MDHAPEPETHHAPTAGEVVAWIDRVKPNMWEERDGRYTVFLPTYKDTPKGKKLVDSIQPTRNTPIEAIHAAMRGEPK